jgi:hypothetical protein
MAIVKGIGSQGQVALVSVLLAVIIILTGWEIRSVTNSASASPPLGPSGGSRPQPSGTMPRKTKFTEADFHLRLHELAGSESIDYASDGRNIFSKVVMPVVIETPLASARLLTPSILVTAPEIKHAMPSLDLKYLGFAESNPGRISALFMHGDDIFVATTGDIMFHRFRVGTIKTSSAQVTDLLSNKTQAIAITN